MNIRLFSLLAIAAACGKAGAQDTYDAAGLATKDLNGTARYVGMGGAMAALGGDVSVMGTNPAGIGIYRTNDVAVTGSLFITGEEAVLGHDKTRASLDNAGVALTTNLDGSVLKYINYGVNYTKRKNFFANTTLPIDNVSGFSQTFQIAPMATLCNETGNWGVLSNIAAPNFSTKDQHDGIVTANGTVDAEGNYVIDSYTGAAASKADFQKHTYGSVSQTDINVAFNLSDQFFLGAALGVYSVNYNRESSYYEYSDKDNYGYTIDSWYNTDGDGFDVKLGFTVRPFKTSPFRMAVYAHTPIWFSLTDVNGAEINYNNKSRLYKSTYEYDYHFRTPWKFGVALGHTVGSVLAFDAEYEYSDLPSSKYTLHNGGESSYFRTVNNYTKHFLKGQSTLRVGVEIKPVPLLSLRLGYNFVSSPFDKNAYRELAYDGVYTETYFTNWKATNRFTAGIGFRFRGGYFDLAYQLQLQKGDFYAFGNQNQDISKGAKVYLIEPTEIKNNRSQVMATLGFKF